MAEFAMGIAMIVAVVVVALKMQWDLAKLEEAVDKRRRKT